MIEIAAIVALLICAGFVPLRLRLFFAIPASVFQLYIPGVIVNGIPLPLSLLAAFSLWPEASKGAPHLLRWKIVTPLFGVFAAFIFSMAWSTDPKLGAATITYWLSFLIIVSAAISVDRVTLLRQLNLTLWLGLMEVALVIVFRLNPDLKILFLQSSFASWFVSENVLEVLFTSAQNNVLSPSKSGGLFVNANVAAAYMAILTVSWLALRSKPGINSRHPRVPFFVLIAYITGIVSTGSKAAAIMVGGFIIIYMWYAVRLFPISRKYIRYIVTFSPFIIVVASVAYITYQLGASTQVFFDQSGETLDTRILIWNYGFHAFINSPLLGQGFGGWQVGFDKYAAINGLSPGYPPHNTFMYLWSQGSLFALVFGAYFAIRLVSFLVRRLRTPYMSESTQDSTILLAALLAFGWTFTQGMGSNFGLIGEQHMAPFLAVLLGLVYQASRRNYELPEDSMPATTPSISAGGLVR